MKPENRFYVYTHAYPESMGGTVFYVGKGQKDRWLAHEREARSDVQSRKCDIIRNIWAHGEQVVRCKVFETPIEQDAYIYEWALINLLYGYENLANFWEGGNGGLVKRKQVYKQVCLSLSQRTLDLIDASTFHTRAELIRQVLQNNDIHAFIDHPALSHLLDTKPRCTFGLQLPLDLVSHLQMVPPGQRSSLIEFLVLEQLQTAPS